MSRYQVKDGFRTPELLLLNRALDTYVRAYMQIKSAGETPQEKLEAQQYIDAAYALGRRLTHELEPIKEQGNGET